MGTATSQFNTPPRLTDNELHPAPASSVFAIESTDTCLNDLKKCNEENIAYRTSLEIDRLVSNKSKEIAAYYEKKEQEEANKNWFMQKPTMSNLYVIIIIIICILFSSLFTHAMSGPSYVEMRSPYTMPTQYTT